MFGPSPRSDVISADDMCPPFTPGRRAQRAAGSSSTSSSTRVRVSVLRELRREKQEIGTVSYWPKADIAFVMAGTQQPQTPTSRWRMGFSRRTGMDTGSDIGSFWQQVL